MPFLAQLLKLECKLRTLALPVRSQPKGLTYATRNSIAQDTQSLRCDVQHTVGQAAANSGAAPAGKSACVSGGFARAGVDLFHHPERRADTVDGRPELL